jgi:hypothetical protein
LDGISGLAGASDVILPFLTTPILIFDIAAVFPSFDLLDGFS